MTSAELRAQAIEVMGIAGEKAALSPNRHDDIMTSALDALGAAGFSVVGPEVTEEMLHAWRRTFNDTVTAYELMVAAADLTRKPE